MHKDELITLHQMLLDIKDYFEYGIRTSSLPVLSLLENQA